MSSRNYPFGTEERKMRKQRDEFIESQRGALNKFVRSNTSTSRNLDDLAIVQVLEQPINKMRGPTLEENVGINRKVTM
jgi:hypothetical protein